MKAEEYCKLAEPYEENVINLYMHFQEKRPVMLVDLQEKRIYAYPYLEYLATLSPRSQTMLKDQYAESIEDDTIVVFVKDNERERLISYSLGYEIL